MSKRNADFLGWPEPSDWVNRLHAGLEKRQADYEFESDQLVRRNKAALMLGFVIESIRELPAFKDPSSYMALKDLLIFLSDLDRGRSHPWAAPVNFGGTNITTTAQGELKLWIRATYSLLIGNGFRAVEAYRHIAAGLNKSGRTARNGSQISWRHVQRFCLDPGNKMDSRIRIKLGAWWLEFQEAYNSEERLSHKRRLGSDKVLVGKFADKLWSLDHLRDRFFSGVSE